MNVLTFSIFRKSIFITIGLFFLTGTANGQTHGAFDIHGLKLGMITREIILHSHAPLDTLFWGGKEGASIFGFHSEWLGDTGEFRVAVDKNEITQITFTSNHHTAEQNRKAVEVIIVRIEKLFGNPEEYHNIYRIVTWKAGSEQLRLTTSDQGVFFTTSLSASQPLSTPGPDELKFKQ